MGKLFHLYFGGLQLANAVIFSGVVLGWLDICPNTHLELAWTVVGASAIFLLFYLMPSSAVVAGGLIFYYVVWVCKLTPLLGFFLAAPAIAISLIALWVSFYDGVNVDHLALWLRKSKGSHFHF